MIIVWRYNDLRRRRCVISLSCKVSLCYSILSSTFSFPFKVAAHSKQDVTTSSWSSLQTLRASHRRRRSLQILQLFSILNSVHLFIHPHFSVCARFTMRLTISSQTNAPCAFSRYLHRDPCAFWLQPLSNLSKTTSVLYS